MAVRDTTVINGNEGTLQVTIAGRVEELAQVREFEAEITYIKEEIRSLSQRMIAHKIIGQSGAGSVTIYYNSHTFRRVATEYKRTGVFPEMSLVPSNRDPQASAQIGGQSVALRRVKPDGVILAMLGESEVLEEDFSFTFEEYDFLTTFRN